MLLLWRTQNIKHMLLLWRTQKFVYNYFDRSHRCLESTRKKIIKENHTIEGTLVHTSKRVVNVNNNKRNKYD